MGENLYKLVIGQKINAQNIERAQNLNTKATKNPINQ
jgi:hypothetical protein